MTIIEYLFEYFSSGRHRDEEVFEMKAAKRYVQLNKLLDMESKLNLSLAMPDPSVTPSSGYASILQGNTSSPLLYTSKHEQLEDVCKSEQLREPCGPNKKWRCHHDGLRSVALIPQCL